MEINKYVPASLCSSTVPAPQTIRPAQSRSPHNRVQRKNERKTQWRRCHEVLAKARGKRLMAGSPGTKKCHTSTLRNLNCFPPAVMAATHDQHSEGSLSVLLHSPNLHVFAVLCSQTESAKARCCRSLHYDTKSFRKTLRSICPL